MKLPFNLAGKAAKGMLMLKAVSPELCAAGSILFGIGCVVSSCIATVKVEPAVRDAIDREETIRKDAKGEMVPMKALSKNERNAVNDIRRSMAIAVAKHYAFPALLGLASIALNLQGVGELRKRLTQTTVALAGLTKSFDEYRKRVIEDQGVEKDQEYMHGVKALHTVEIDQDTGEVKSESKAYVREKPGISQYARWFDQGVWDVENHKWIHQNPAWKEDPDQNLATLRYLQAEMNRRLIRDKYLFLNDVYRRLGLTPTDEGQIVGWLYDSEKGDHAVSFAVFDDDPRQLPCNRRFTAGETPDALLDFNVDGPIINDLANLFGRDNALRLSASAT